MLPTYVIPVEVHFIIMTSYLTPCHLKSPATQLCFYSESIIKNKENYRPCITDPLCHRWPVDTEYQSITKYYKDVQAVSTTLKMSCHVKNIMSMSWHHYLLYRPTAPLEFHLSYTPILSVVRIIKHIYIIIVFYQLPPSHRPNQWW